MRTSYVVRFFHRGAWHVFEEYGPTMEDVATLKALQLSTAFGDAEVRKIATTTQYTWEDGVLLELLHMKDGNLETHMAKGA